MNFVDWCRKTHNRLTQPWPGEIIQVVPANSPGPWTSSNAIGQEQAFAPDSNNKQTILKLDELGLPTVWTLILGTSYQDNAWPGVAGNLGITASIEIGVGGTTKTIQVDWQDGAVISLPMNAVNVVAQYRALFPLLPIAPPTGLRLNAMLARGGRSGAFGPTFTEDWITPVIPFPFTSKYQRIPVGAASLVTNVYEIGGTNNFYLDVGYLEMSQSVNGTLTNGVPLVTVPITKLQPPNAIRVPGQARYFRYIVHAPVANLSAIVPVFELNF